jgi:hypothetical protein
MTEVQTALRLNSRDPEARTLEVKLKAMIKEQGGSEKGGAKKKGIFEQIKEILNKKI